VSELSRAARKVAFRSANDALRRDIQYAELRDALRALRDATATNDRTAIELALARADKALAESEPK
jgi:hypothetical protein